MLKIIAGRDIEGRILANDGVRAGSSLDCGDAGGVDQTGTPQPFGILLRD